MVCMYVLHGIGGVACMGISVEHLSVAYCVYVQYLCVSISQQGCRDWTPSAIPLALFHTSHTG